MTKQKEIDWEKVKSGQKFSAIINKKKCFGKIQKEVGDVFFCQNENDGSDAFFKHGYKYSWSLDSYVKDIQLLRLFPESHIPPKLTPKPLFINKDSRYAALIKKGHIVVGCQKISNAMVRKIASKLIDK